MNDLVKESYILIYWFVGIISIIMGVKLLTAKKFLPFHEQASGTTWESIDARVRLVISALMKVAGLGFLVNSALMIMFPWVAVGPNGIFFKYAIPSVGFLYCLGLFVVTFDLYRKTRAQTPWKKSLVAMVLILIGMFLSSL